MGESLRDDDRLATNWARIVDAILRGDRPTRGIARLGPTPSVLQSLGLMPSDIAIAVNKIAKCRREHPEVSLAVWHELPRYLERPLAVVPSSRRDGSLVVVLVVADVSGSPVLVPIAPGIGGAPNMVLSVYGKDAGMDWVRQELRRAAGDALPHFASKGFAAAKPQPGSANAIPSSPGPIPADGTTKPDRSILTITPKVKKVTEDG